MAACGQPVGKGWLLVRGLALIECEIPGVEDIAPAATLGLVEEAIRSGADVVPKVTTVVAYDRPRTVGDTEQGEEIRERVVLLERLVEAYREGAIG